MPKLLEIDYSLKSQTAYEEIPLGVEGKAGAMTAIYVPPKVSGKSVNLLLYFHGHKADALAMDDYLAKTQYHFREELLRMNAQVVFVAPTMGPKSQPGKLEKDVRWYLDEVKQAMKTDLGFPDGLDWFGIALACHSGGGVAMRAVAKQLGGRVGECWGFDCLYNDGDPTFWADWAKANPRSTVRVFYHGSTSENSQTLAGIADKKGLKNVFVKESDAIAHDGRSDHENVPSREFGRALKRSWDTLGPTGGSR
jgi:hypothetical protein